MQQTDKTQGIITHVENIDRDIAVSKSQQSKGYVMTRIDEKVIKSKAIINAGNTGSINVLFLGLCIFLMPSSLYWVWSRVQEWLTCTEA